MVAGVKDDADEGVERAADLAELLAAAGQENPAMMAAAQAREAAQGDADEVEAQQWAALPALVGSVLVIALPEVADAYSAEACANWGRAAVPVARKYGLSAGGMGPEMALLVATLPFALPTWFAVRSRKAQAAQAAPAEGAGGRMQWNAAEGPQVAGNG